MPQLTEWLKLMLSEIARKREDAERANQEEMQRRQEQTAPESRKDARTTTIP